MEHTIKIGGKEREVLLLEKTCKEIAKRFNKVYTMQKYDKRANKELADVKKHYENLHEDLGEYFTKAIITEEEFKEQTKQLNLEEIKTISLMKTIIPDKYYYQEAWNLLAKKGIWPFKKPFRSAKHMYNNLLKGEAQEIVVFINKEVLGYKTTIVDDSKKKG